MISIIIVNYKVKEHLFSCIESIGNSAPKTPYEIIVVDNDEKPTIGKDLKKKFSSVKYMRNSKNIGFGAGNNRGEKIATGEYILFLNPDTKVFPNTVDNLVQFINSHKDTAIVAPLLLGKDSKPYQQGASELTPLRGMICLSFINKIFPNNPIAKSYWLQDWNRKTIKEVGVAPGTAFAIRKEIFEKVGGFDENFFLYFEEFDLCRRIRKLGYKIFIIPSSKVAHIWGSSTSQREDKKSIFEKSRFYYFKKNFGLIPALLTEAIVRTGKYTILLAGIIMLGEILRLVRINETMELISDQGWFYLSARDLLIEGKIPLVGITSSHPWLHQGALWTYLVAGSFLIFNFNPIAPAYLTAAFDGIAIFLFYIVGKTMFSKKHGVIAAALYATSPLVIYNIRAPYHTSLIPLFTIILIYCLYKWISGKKLFFPAVLGALVILYSLEIATFVFVILTLIILLFGLWKRKKWAIEVFQKKIILYSFFTFIIGMLPMLIYDVMHGFPQTVKFIAWIGYRILVIFGYPPLTPIETTSLVDMLKFSIDHYRQFIFPYNWSISTALFIISFSFVIIKLIKMLPKKIDTNTAIIWIINIIPLAIFFFMKTPSEAYLPMLFPGLILIAALFFGDFLSRKRLKIPVYGMLLCIIALNIHHLISHNYYFTNRPDAFTQRLMTTKRIISESEGKEYNLVGESSAHNYPSITKNYEYLAWWLGHGPSEEKAETQIIINEDYGISITKNQNKK